jgi:signal peptidase I
MHKLVKNKDITLVDVLSVSMQPAGSGNNYFLVLKIADQYKKVGKYHVLVWGIPKSTSQPWKVLSFQYVGN